MIVGRGRLGRCVCVACLALGAEARAATTPPPRATAMQERTADEADPREESNAAEPTRAERLASWQESLDLDLPGEVLDGARAWPGGADALARDGEATLLVALAHAAQGRADDARALLETITGDAAPRAVAELAALDIEADDLDAAFARLANSDGALHSSLNDTPRAHYQLGRAFVRAADLAAARAPLEALVQRWPWHADGAAAWHMLAQEALARRDLDRARACRESAAELGRWHAFYRTRREQRRAAPDAPEPRVGLAQLWIAAREFARARDELAPVLRDHPDYCPGWTTLGELERKEAHLDAAREAYERALDCDATAALPRFALAMLALEEGDGARAREHLGVLCDSPAASEPRYLRAHIELARLLHAAGDDAAAARYARYRALGGTEALEPSPR